HLRKVNIKVTVGVRLGQVAVVHLVTGKFQRTSLLSRLIRPAYFRQWFQSTLKRNRSNCVTQVHSGLFMSDDDAAVSTNSFIRSRLLRMPVSVDQCLDAAVTRSFLHSL